MAWAVASRARCSAAAARSSASSTRRRVSAVGGGVVVGRLAGQPLLLHRQHPAGLLDLAVGGGAGLLGLPLGAGAQLAGLLLGGEPELVGLALGAREQVVGLALGQRRSCSASASARARCSSSSLSCTIRMSSASRVASALIAWASRVGLLADLGGLALGGLADLLGLLLGEPEHRAGAAAEPAYDGSVVSSASLRSVLELGLELAAALLGPSGSRSARPSQRLSWRSAGRPRPCRSRRGGRREGGRGRPRPRRGGCGRGRRGAGAARRAGRLGGRPAPAACDRPRWLRAARAARRGVAASSARLRRGRRTWVGFSARRIGRAVAWDGATSARVLPVVPGCRRRRWTDLGRSSRRSSFSWGSVAATHTVRSAAGITPGAERRHCGTRRSDPAEAVDRVDVLARSSSSRTPRPSSGARQSTPTLPWWVFWWTSRAAWPTSSSG